MNFFFAKLFQEYKSDRLNDIAEDNITAYISLLCFMVFFGIYLVGSVFIENKLLLKRPEYGIIYTLVIFLLSIVSIYKFVRHKYITKQYIYTLTAKYKKRKFNTFLLYFIAGFLPVFIILLGTTLTVLINGGEILNYPIQGLIK